MMSRDSSLEDSIALITSAKNDTSNFGSSFIIKKTANATYWLTCAHVVLDVGGIDNLRIADHSATLAGCSEDELATLKNTSDLVVLRVEDLFKKVPLDLVHSQKKKLSFSVTGHYKNEGAKQIYTGSLYGDLIIPSDGSVLTSEGYSKTLNLEVDSKSRLLLQPGYSGSPVLIKGKKQVVGVVVQRYDNRKGIAISVEAAKQIFRKVPELQDILIRKVFAFGIKIAESEMASIEIKQLESLSPDVQEALKWLRDKGGLAKQASNHVSDTLPSFKNIADDVKSKSLQDLCGDIEKYLEYVYDSLLNENDNRLIRQTRRPSRPIAEYEIAFSWIKDNIPSHINHDVAENIRKKLDCLSSNISYRR